MKNKFKSNFILISSITFPILSLFLVLLIVELSERPKEEHSTYRQAINHFEQKDTSPANTMLSSNLFQGKTNENDKKDFSKLSNIEIFNDKLSLPQPQLGHNLEYLESEHKQILKDLEFKDEKHSEVIQLNLRYRIVLSFFIDINPAELTDEVKKDTIISPEEKYFLEKLSQSEDLKLLLEKNKLTPEYVSLKNLKKLYASDKEMYRAISSRK